MHAAARSFLAGRGLTGAKPDQIDPENVFFELTKDEKVARAHDLACDVFIDDLPEILEPGRISAPNAQDPVRSPKPVRKRGRRV